MSNILHLENGLKIETNDHTQRYYGDFYNVELEIICEAPVLEDYFADAAEFTLAVGLLRERVFYRRILRQTGVPSTEIERVRERLLASFSEHSLPYFKKPGFPKKLVLSELEKMRNKQAKMGRM